MLASPEQQDKGPKPVTQEKNSASVKTYKQPSRAGKVNVTGYFAPSVKSSFRMIQTKYPEKTIQDLLSEALNDLFVKYDVPQTAHSEE